MAPITTKFWFQTLSGTLKTRSGNSYSGFFVGRRKLYIFLHVLRQQEATMAISSSDVIPLSHARANFSELAEDVRGGAEKIITKNGEAYIAIIDAKRLDYYHQLERERIHLLLIDEASKGLDDVAAGRVQDARSALQAIKSRRSSSTSASA
jgi:prevent-host-death family protein